MEWKMRKFIPQKRIKSLSFIFNEFEYQNYCEYKLIISMDKIHSWMEAELIKMVSKGK